MINSILSYSVLLFHKAGLSAPRAAQGDLVVKVTNCIFTLVAFGLVDRKGRKFLLVLGTSGIVVSLLCAGMLFRSIESKSIDVRSATEGLLHPGVTHLPLDDVRRAANLPALEHYTLTVLYDDGSGEKIASASSSDPNAVVELSNSSRNPKSFSPTVLRAQLAPLPAPRIGIGITACLCLFIAFFAVGPGVVVWLALSELMPTRIRSKGMGVALLLNQGVSTASAAVFLPVVGHFGASAMLLAWSAFTVIYLLIAVGFLPETKGKRLEEIERLFEPRKLEVRR